MHGYGCGCSKCYKPVCCPQPCYTSSCPPQVAGAWIMQLENLVRQATGPDVSCADINDVTAAGTTPITLTLTQCAKPRDAFVTGLVAAGPTGASPIVPGDQLLGIFHKDSRRCWELNMVSPTDNTTFRVNFKGSYQCPKQFNFSYTKPVDSPTGFGAVGGGCGTKL